jgi:hypothetical protein
MLAKQTLFFQDLATLFTGVQNTMSAALIVPFGRLGSYQIPEFSR